MRLKIFLRSNILNISKQNLKSGRIMNCLGLLTSFWSHFLRTQTILDLRVIEEFNGNWMTFLDQLKWAQKPKNIEELKSNSFLTSKY